MKITESIRNILSHGLAAGLMAVGSVRDSLVYGVEYLTVGGEDKSEARFGDLHDVAGPTGAGFCINGSDSMSTVASFSNSVCMGSTGSGKTSVLAACTMLRLDGASVIAHDPSGQLINITAPYLVSKGYDVHVLDFNDPLHSSCVNPMDFIATTSDANKLATSLVRATLGTRAQDKFWELSATSLLRLLMSLLLRLEDKYRNLANLRHLLKAMAGESKAVDLLMAKHASDTDFLDYKALIKGNEKTLSSIIMTAQAALGLWEDDKVCRLTSSTTIDFAAFRSGRCALFLKNSTSDAQYIRPLISMVLDGAMKVYMSNLPDKGDGPVFFIIDECATLSLESLDQVLSNNRKAKIGFQLFYQNQAQVFDAHGQDAGTNILANCNAKVYLTGMDMKTARELEQALGRRSVAGRSGSRRDVPLMSATELRMMGREEAIMLYGSHRPFRMRMVPYYRQPLLRMRAGRKPFIFMPKVQAPIVHLIPLK